MFEAVDFENACAELDVANVDDYEFFTESHDVKIYRQYNEETGLYAYKIYGRLSDVDPETCVEVYMDTEYRKEWDSYVKELGVLSKDGEMQNMYWQVNFPFPLWNRDYTFARQLRQFDLEGRHVAVVLARGQELDTQPPRKGVVRCKGYYQSMAITSDGEVGTKAFMHYYDNPGGNIPTWLINWAAKTGVPTFLKQMQKACRGYKEYKEKLAKSASS